MAAFLSLRSRGSCNGQLNYTLAAFNIQHSQHSLDETNYRIQLGGKAMSMASKYVPLNPCATVQVLSSGVKSAPTLKAHSRESETFVDFREKINFFIGPHK